MGGTAAPVAIERARRIDRTGDRVALVPVAAQRTQCTEASGEGVEVSRLRRVRTYLLSTRVTATPLVPRPSVYVWKSPSSKRVAEVHLTMEEHSLSAFADSAVTCYTRPE